MNPTPASQQQFCVRWNSHLGSLGAAFPQLLAGQRFVDVTLACEGHQLHCHRLVLAACSSYFENLLSENPCKHPIIIMPHDIKLWEIQALVDFMYKGEVNVSQHGLPNLLKCAEVLQIRGLHGSDAALNLNSVDKTSSGSPNKDTNNSPPGQSLQPASLLAPGGVTTIGASLNVIASGSGTVTPTGTSSSSPLCSVPILTPATSTSLLTSGIGVNNISNSALQKNTGGSTSNSAVSSCTSTNSHTIVGSSTFHGTGVNHTKRTPSTSFDTVTPINSGKDRHQQQYSTSTPNSSIITPKLEPVDVSIVEDIDDDSINTVGDVTKTERDDADYSEGSIKQPNDFALANVICEYDGGLQISMDNAPGRRVRRSEAILRQAAECVSKGQTFQTVSDMFNIPISTIRFFMARKGILPRRKRGRAAGVSIIGGGHMDFQFNPSTDNSRSASPSEPPFHFAHYKLPEMKPNLL